MELAKVAGGVLFLLLLACSQAVPLLPAAFANDVWPNDMKAPPLTPPPSTEECTHAQKVEILHECRDYIKNERPITFPLNNSPCCNAVRRVPNLDMVCIYNLLTTSEKILYHQRRFKLGLRRLCRPIQSSQKNEDLNLNIGCPIVSYGLKILRRDYYDNKIKRFYGYYEIHKGVVLDIL
uniref:Bifunctional inhibitor/plant lipid transfer protein/seed storage helical domain-containing protein n=1 Tax=Leersia perrieri TaxID=77586 RepID=A0A0D9XIR2_9ORYZ